MKVGLAFLFLLTVSMGNSVSTTVGHEWTDVSGNYRIEAELVARNETSLVLQLRDKSMLLVDIAQLCAADKKYLELLQSELEAASKENTAESKLKSSKLQAWQLRNGLKVYGTVVDFGKRLVVIRRRNGKIYVNDRPFKNLPEMYQKLVPLIINHFEKQKIADEKQLGKWLGKQQGNGKAFTVEGVLIETYTGDLYGIPFFVFKEDDQAILKPGWEDWLESEENAKYQAELGLRLQAQAIAKQQKEFEARQIARLHLQTAAYDAGIFDLWEVSMVSPNGQGYPIRVVVPARNSKQAGDVASASYPGYRVIALAKVIRKNRR